MPALWNPLDIPRGRQEATSLAIDIYKITSAGDFGKNYGLCDQLRRAADSIASNTCPVK